MDVRERFLRAIDHIEAHLLEPVSLAAAAACAELSPAHFSRLFRALTGEPFGFYLRRRRLTVAAERLSAGRAAPPLARLAFDCRYNSQEAFTRAFKRAFGVTPGAYRARRSVGFARGRRPIDAETLHFLTEVLHMEPEIREIASFAVVGMRERFDEDTKHGIPALWSRFGPRRHEVPRQRPDDTYGVCLNADPKTGSFDYVAGVAVNSVDRLSLGFVAETVPRQTYAVFRHDVRSTSLHKELKPTVRWIWGTWLPSAHYDYVPGPDFERYPPEFDSKKGTGFLEICIPVRRRA